MTDKPVLSTFNNLNTFDIQKYKRYLPTAFDESLSLLEKVNMVIDGLNNMVNDFNTVVTQVNAVQTWALGDGLTQDVDTKLDEMANDGTLDTIINQQVFGQINTDITTLKNKEVGIVSVFEYGAKGDDVTDDWQAITDTISYALTNNIPRVVANGKHRISKPIVLDNLPEGFMLFFDELRPTDTFVGGELVTIAKNSTALLKNIKIHINVVDGLDRSKNISGIRNYGMQFSHIYMGTVINTDRGYYVENNIFACNDTVITGELNNMNNYGFYINADTTKGHAENTRIIYNFTANNRYGGVYLRNGCAFIYVEGALDFNGQGLTEIEVSADGLFSVGETVNGATSGASGQVISVYNRRGKHYILVIHNGAFSQGENVSDGTNTSVAITVKKGSDNVVGQYFDIINERKEGSFSRNHYNLTYIDTIVGEFIDTDTIFRANVSNMEGSAINGFITYYDSINKQIGMISNRTGDVFLRMDDNGDLHFYPVATSKNVIFDGNTFFRGNMISFDKDVSITKDQFNFLVSGNADNLNIVKNGGGTFSKLSISAKISEFLGGIKPLQFQTATKPLPSDYGGCLAVVTDDAVSGTSCLLFSDGTNWKRVSDNTVF